MSPQDLGADTRQNNGLNRSSTLLSKTRSLQDFIYFKKRLLIKQKSFCSLLFLNLFLIFYFISHFKFTGNHI